MSWRSRKQRTVAFSKTEDEYMGFSDACKEELFIKAFMSECFNMGINLVIFNDVNSLKNMFYARTSALLQAPGSRRNRESFTDKQCNSSGVIVIKSICCGVILADV